MTDIGISRLPPAGTLDDRFVEAVTDEGEAHVLQSTYAAMITEQRLPWLVDVRPMHDGSRAPGRKRSRPRRAYGIYLVYDPGRTYTDLPAYTPYAQSPRNPGRRTG